ncbi:MAG: hypothetical protein WCP12_18285 [bacterium]
MYNNNEEAVFKHKALLVCVNRTVSENANVKEVYEGARYAWNLRIELARQAQVVLAIRYGQVVGVFEPTEWLDATAENFPGRVTAPGRYGFNGKVAPKSVSSLYLGKRLSPEHKLFGPIRYVGIPS